MTLLLYENEIKIIIYYYKKQMPVLCCLGDKPKKKVYTSPITSFRDRLPEHIKNLTVDVTSQSTDTQPKYVPSPVIIRSWDYGSDSD